MSKRPQKTITPQKANATPPFLSQLLICAALFTITLLLYFPVRHFDFINYDDPDYITQNPYVQSGFTKESLTWAFSRIAGDATYWHPLTWMSHMLDCQLFKLNAGAHHLTNVFIHALNALLLFLVFKKMTGALWRSALIAALFAWHPIQVDTVAWVTERKNVLSTFFWLLTMWAYICYAQTTTPSAISRNEDSKRWLFYSLTIISFALGLMCKPMLVTLPCVLLLLDFWPLKRLSILKSQIPNPSDKSRLIPSETSKIKAHGASQNAGTRFPSPGGEGWCPSGRTEGGFNFLLTLNLKNLPKLIFEKLPLFLLSAASSYITIQAHRQLGLVASEKEITFLERLINSLVSYMLYAGKILWPDKLTVFYPFPETWPVGQIIMAILFLLVLSAGAVALLRQQPFLLVGWLWFLGTFVPVIGLLQVSIQSMAERFAYVPMIGFLLLIVWSIPELLKSLSKRTSEDRSQIDPRRPTIPPLPKGEGRGEGKGTVLTFLGPTFAACALLACLTLTSRQVRHWQNSETLFRHAIHVIPNNIMAEVMLGNALETRGDLTEALQHYDNALRLKPDFPQVHYNLGNLLIHENKLDEAVAHYLTALQQNPDYAEAHANLGYALGAQHKYDDAISHYKTALKLRPNDPDLRRNLAIDLATTRKFDEALSYLTEALQLKPNDPVILILMGDVFTAQRKFTEAAAQYSQALQLQPDNAEARRKLERTPK